nr:glutathione S transferase [Hymenolepis microstoma]
MALSGGMSFEVTTYNSSVWDVKKIKVVSILEWIINPLHLEVADVRCNLEIDGMQVCHPYPEFSGFESSCLVKPLQHPTEGSAEVVVRPDKDDFSHWNFASGWS